MMENPLRMAHQYTIKAVARALYEIWLIFKPKAAYDAALRRTDMVTGAAAS